MNTSSAPQSTAAQTSEAMAAPLSNPAPPPAPSVHVRALITWLAIFPLVAVGMLLIGPFSENWPPVLRAFVLTLVVVPLAVYFVVPRLFAGYGAIMRRRRAAR